MTGPPPPVGAVALVASWRHHLRTPEVHAVAPVSATVRREYLLISMRWGSDFATAKPMDGGEDSAPLIDDELYPYARRPPSDTKSPAGCAATAERERIYPHLQLVPMPLGKVLYESGDVLRHVYFPTDSIVSLLYVMADGASAEISVVGNEGLIGIALFMGGETTPSRAIVQSAGYAYRLVGQRLKEEFHRNGAMQLLLLRYTQALITQMAQTAVCNRHHSVDQQLCRWLLLSLDRLPSNQLTMTQELIANMLGVRREGVTEAAGKLQKLGVIRYARGQITVLDRPRLEQLCCECYAVVKKETDRLLPQAARSVRVRDRSGRGRHCSRCARVGEFAHCGARLLCSNQTFHG